MFKLTLFCNLHVIKALFIYGPVFVLREYCYCLYGLSSMNDLIKQNSDQCFCFSEIYRMFYEAFYHWSQGFSFICLPVIYKGIVKKRLYDILISYSWKVKKKMEQFYSCCVTTQKIIGLRAYFLGMIGVTL